MKLLRAHFKLAKDSLRRHRSRSLLSCLGIAIGIASIILIISLTGSIKQLLSSHLNTTDNLILIRPAHPDNDLSTELINELTMNTHYQPSTLSLTDIKTISEIENIAAIAPIAKFDTTIWTSDNRTSSAATILGTNANFLDIEPYSLSSGIFLDKAKSANAAVIGHSAALQLFGNSNPIGQSVYFSAGNFIIVGVLAETTNAINIDNINLNSSILVQASSLAELDINLQIQQINLKVNNPANLATTANTIQQTLTQAKSSDANFSVIFGDQITQPENSLLFIVSSILTLVAGIALIVGGIGVMNIMLVSVSERSHEIGIRKAVGASNFNIFSQFLFESLILCFSGGFLGFILAYLMAFLICLITPFNPFISWHVLTITFLTSLSIGLVFGLYPAFKAARKSPIETLKSCYN